MVGKKLLDGLVDSSTMLNMQTQNAAAADLNNDLSATTAPPVRAWSEQQTAFFAAVAAGERDVFLDAKAGTGKTTSLVEAASLLKGKTVLALAFNSKTAAELKARMPPHVESKSFNAFGFGQLFRRLGRVEVDRDRVRKLAEMVVPDRRELKKQWVHLRQLVSLTKGELVYTIPEIDALVDKYEMDLADCEGNAKLRPVVVQNTLKVLRLARDVDRSVDFDDQIWLPEVLDLNTKKFDRILVDEVQDMNPAQYALVLRALAPGGHIIAVGDPRQAIYGFRGAGGSGMVNRFLAEREALHMPLSVTFRCPKLVVAEVVDIVPGYVAHESAPDGEVVHAHWDNEIDPKQIEKGAFVISRTNAPLVRHCLAFVAKGVRATMLGRDFGGRLIAIIDASQQTSVGLFIKWLNSSEQTEMSHMREGFDDKKAAELLDRNNSLRALAEGLTDINALRSRIETFFAAEPDGVAVVFTSTHKAKGLENRNVYVFADTYKSHNEEERNMWYVALTRSQYKLVLCEGGVK